MYETNEPLLSPGDYVAILKRRKWELIVPTLLVFLIALGLAIKLPTRYQSSATILIEQQEIPIDLVRSTVTSYADQRIEVIRQRVMTTQSLGQIVERYNLFPELREERGLPAAVEQIRSNITLETISAEVGGSRSGSATIAFSLSYQAGNPEQAQRVTNDIVSLFLEENLSERKRTAQEATRFLEQESNKLAEQVTGLEARLASFKEEHGDAIPEMAGVNLQLLQRAEENLRLNEQEIRALEINAIYLESELAKLSPFVNLQTVTGEPVLGPAERLRTLETELLRLRSRYAETHPDRVAVEREIEVLRQELARRGDDAASSLAELRQRLAALRGRYSDEHPDVKSLERQIAAAEQSASTGGGTETQGASDAQNPAYIQIQAQLVANQNKLDALRQARQALEARLRDLEARVAAAPKIEREYLLITRDYDSAVAKYNQVKSKLFEATLAESLETERKGERFTLIEPPLLPDRPISPNRPAIVLLGFVLAVGSGVGGLAARELLDAGLYSIHTIQNLTGSAPLAIIPRITTTEERRRRILIALGIVVGFVIIVGITLLAIHVFYKPLDVLWFRIAARFTG